MYTAWLNKTNIPRDPIYQTNWYIHNKIWAFMVAMVSIVVMQVYLFKIILIPSFSRVGRWGGRGTSSSRERSYFTLDYPHPLLLKFPPQDECCKLITLFRESRKISIVLILLFYNTLQNKSSGENQAQISKVISQIF